MHTALTEPSLRFPLSEPPPFGAPMEVAPGVLWLRLPLPYRLDHINVHLIEDGDGSFYGRRAGRTAEPKTAWRAMPG